MEASEGALVPLKTPKQGVFGGRYATFAMRACAARGLIEWTAHKASTLELDVPAGGRLIRATRPALPRTRSAGPYR
jgi:hypothetical protein